MRPIHDASGKTIGYENDVSPYRKEISNRSGALQGYFNPKHGPEGSTFTKSGKMIGNGDQRSRFIRDE